MDFQTAIRTCLNKYADFNGRARRSEFWWFVLFGVLVGFVAGIIDRIIGTDGVLGSNGLVGTVASLALLVPNLAVGARRLHDIDKSGWLQLLWIIPIVGWIILIIWYATDTKQGDNQYGPNPKTGAAGGYPPPPPAAPYGGGQYGG